MALAEVAPYRRAALALVLALAVLLLASQASYALARNVAFSSTVFSRTPGLGPVLEACAFALGCWLPRPADRGQRPGARRRSLVSVISGFDDRGVGGGERRDGSKHDRDRQPVHHAGDAAPAPSDSPNAPRPQASATSAVAAVISEMPGTAAPVSSAAWKQRKPANVPATATSRPAAQQARRPVVMPVERDRLDGGVGEAVEDAGGGGPRDRRPDPPETPRRRRSRAPTATISRPGSR